MKDQLQQEIADFSRIRSAEQIKIKKLQEEQKRLNAELKKQVNDISTQQKFTDYLNREKKINIDMIAERNEKKFLKELQD